MDELRQLVDSCLETLKSETDPVVRTRRATATVAYLQEKISDFGTVRRDALVELAKTMSHAEIAVALDYVIGRARISQLLASGGAAPPPERALLGTDALTVAIAGKTQSGALAASAPSAVISAECVAAFQLLSDAGAAYGWLPLRQEIVRAPGDVCLNRSNLLVLGSPRLFPLISQLLGADRNLGFQAGPHGWYLTEKGRIFTSPSDAGEPADFAYLGRLPRPDGKGSFAYAAGIHAMGTLGAVHYLLDHLTDLYDQVRTRRWSALVRVDYDDQRNIQSTQLLTPIYS